MFKLLLPLFFLSLISNSFAGSFEPRLLYKISADCSIAIEVDPSKMEKMDDGTFQGYSILGITSLGSSCDKLEFPYDESKIFVVYSAENRTITFHDLAYKYDGKDVYFSDLVYVFSERVEPRPADAPRPVYVEGQYWPDTRGTKNSAPGRFWPDYDGAGKYQSPSEAYSQHVMSLSKKKK